MARCGREGGRDVARAYHESQGDATRFQWGVTYLRGLVRLRPSEDVAIGSAAHQVLGELDGEGRLYGRSGRRLITLAKILHDWNDKGQHVAAILAVRTQVGDICAKLPSEDPAQAMCVRFLKTVRPLAASQVLMDADLPRTVELARPGA